MTKSGLSLAPRSASRFSRSSDSRLLQGLGSGCMERPKSCRHELARLELRCDVHTLGDPVPGEDGKHCQCLVKHGRDSAELESGPQAESWPHAAKTKVSSKSS